MRLIQEELFLVDGKCRIAVEDDGKANKRSLELEERINIGPFQYQSPSDIMWSAPWQCLIVEMGMSEYHPWSGSAQAMIGTRGFCGCIAVAIVGNGGAVVSHLVTVQDMKPRLDLMFAKFLSMHGQYDIQAYVFSPQAGGKITQAMEAVARIVAIEVRDFITRNMQSSVVLGSYAVGGDSPEFARLGTLVTTIVQVAIKLWVNDVLINE